MPHRATRTFDLGDELVNVGLVVGQTVVCNCEFSVGSSSSTVTIRKIVDDNLNEVFLARRGLLRSSVSKVGTQQRGLGDLIKPGEGGNIGNLGCLRSGGGVGDISNSSLNFSCIVRREVYLEFNAGDQHCDTGNKLLKTNGVTGERVSSDWGTSRARSSRCYCGCSSRSSGGLRSRDRDGGGDDGGGGCSSWSELRSQHEYFYLTMQYNLQALRVVRVREHAGSSGNASSRAIWKPI